jgi:hypothetical protein
MPTHLNLFEKVWDVLIIKRQAATQQGVQDDAAAPHVNLRPRVQLAGDDLRLLVRVKATVTAKHVRAAALYRAESSQNNRQARCASLAKQPQWFGMLHIARFMTSKPCTSRTSGAA